LVSIYLYSFDICVYDKIESPHCIINLLILLTITNSFLI
jgi:hypothetical protein